MALQFQPGLLYVMAKHGEASKRLRGQACLVVGNIRTTRAALAPSKHGFQGAGAGRRGSESAHRAQRINSTLSSPVPSLNSAPFLLFLSSSGGTATYGSRALRLTCLTAHVPYGSRARAEQLEPVELGTWGTFQASLCSGPSYSLL